MRRDPIIFIGHGLGGTIIKHVSTLGINIQQFEHCSLDIN